MENPQRKKKVYDGFGRGESERIVEGRGRVKLRDKVSAWKRKLWKGKGKLARDAERERKRSRRTNERLFIVSHRSPF